MNKKKISSATALGIILSSLLLSLTLFLFFFSVQTQRKKDPENRITAIIQTGPNGDALKTQYLAELLNLSIDEPKNLFAFNIKAAEEKLKSSPFIKEAHVEKIPPGTLYIDYTLRTPKAWFGDLDNRLIDEKGFFFPAYPFLSPKIFPEIYFGFFENVSEPAFQKERVVSPKFTLAMSVLKALEEMQKTQKFSIQRIDVSQSFHPSYGQREIIVQITQEIFLEKGEQKFQAYFPQTLRLSPFSFPKQLGNYLVLWESMIQDYQKQMTKNIQGGGEIKFNQRTIDLRIEPIALIDEKEIF